MQGLMATKVRSRSIRSVSEAVIWLLVLQITDHVLSFLIVVKFDHGGAVRSAQLVPSTFALNCAVLGLVA